MSRRAWSETLRGRFPRDEVLDRESAFQRYWNEFPKRDVFEFFDLVEVEYGIPAGLLRPEDPLALLLTPISTKNPLKWLFFQASTEDAASELNYRLGKRLARAGVQPVEKPLVTIGEYVRFWCSEGAEG